MKKIIYVLIIILISFPLFAETKTSSIQLQGAYSSALNMNINAIAAQTESYLSGMPFNIEEEFVRYNRESDGRAIATWNVLSNTKFNIYIKASDMVHIEDADHTYPLSYILTFSYNLSYPNVDFNNSGSFWVTSGIPDNSKTGSSSSNVNISVETVAEIEGEEFYKINLFENSDGVVFNTGFTGSVDGRMYFKFTQESDADLHGTATKNNYEAGNYTATVTFFIEEDDV